MSLKNLTNIKISYYTLSDNVVEDLLLPCLNEAVEYKRAVAYFSSKVLLRMSHGLWNLAKKNGKMKLLVSPNLEVEDYEAMKNGYNLRELRDKVTEQIIDAFDFNIDFDQKDARFSLLTYMIATNLLEIKIVLIADKPTRALFHRKTGIFTDEDGNVLTFAGSSNDSESGYEDNDEVWEISRSWCGSESLERCIDRNSSFDSIWDNADSKYITIPFPDVIKNKLLDVYNKDKSFVDYTQIDELFLKQYYARPKIPRENTPFVPPRISLTDYQDKAIRNWVANNYRGIFDMATGTGKTYAAAGAISKLFSDKKRIIVVVCCPTTILVEQWADELKKFNIDAIKCYSSSKNYDERLNRSFSSFRRKLIDFVCIVTTNATFQKKKMQALMTQYLSDILLIVDEAHNFGGEKIIQTLNLDYPYRLALSATFERKGDDEGTDILYDFFEKKCIEYDTGKALAQGYLCHYYYYPICVSMSLSEYDEYVNLSIQYAKYASHKNGQTSESSSENNDNKYFKSKNSQINPILLKRARLIAGVEDKITKLKVVMEDYKNKYNMLVYCGDPYVSIDGSENNDEGQARQIDRVASELNIELGIDSVKFTASEDSETRKLILDQFKNNAIQAIVAIKCLDEGVDIPAINTAFILASTTNPRQYIQRRGRLLRLSPGKEYAVIYDFIVLPREKGTSYSYRNNAHWSIEKNLVRKEFERMKEFATLSENPTDYFNLRDELEDEYELNIADEEEKNYGG